MALNPSPLKRSDLSCHWDILQRQIQPHSLSQIIRLHFGHLEFTELLMDVHPCISFIRCRGTISFWEEFVIGSLQLSNDRNLAGGLRSSISVYGCVVVWMHSCYPGQPSTQKGFISLDDSIMGTQSWVWSNAWQADGDSYMGVSGERLGTLGTGLYKMSVP